MERILDEAHKDIAMQRLWCSYQKRYDYAVDISWNKIIDAVETLDSIID